MANGSLQFRTGFKPCVMLIFFLNLFLWACFCYSLPEYTLKGSCSTSFSWHCFFLSPAHLNCHFLLLCQSTNPNLSFSFCLRFSPGFVSEDFFPLPCVKIRLYWGVDKIMYLLSCGIEAVTQNLWKSRLRDVKGFFSPLLPCTSVAFRVAVIYRSSLLLLSTIAVYYGCPESPLQFCLSLSQLCWMTSFIILIIRYSQERSFQ